MRPPNDKPLIEVIDKAGLKEKCVTHPLNPPPVRGTFVACGDVAELKNSFPFSVFSFPL